MGRTMAVACPTLYGHMVRKGTENWVVNHLPLEGLLCVRAQVSSRPQAATPLGDR